MELPPTPEHDKLHACKDAPDGNGLPGLAGGRWVPIVKWGGGGYTHVEPRIRLLVARYFDVNIDAYDAEKEAVYQAVREQAERS